MKKKRIGNFGDGSCRLEGSQVICSAFCIKERFHVVIADITLIRLRYLQLI